MANRALFQCNVSANTNARNLAGAKSYALSPKHALVQLAITGCFNQTFYANGEAQLKEVIELCFNVEGEFIAKAAIYAREHGQMKDMPALLLAFLASFHGELFEKAFPRVIDNGKMLRNFVQMIRSGAVARKSLGTRPKRLVKRWLESASDQRLIHAMVGNQPALADIIKMVHPRANSPQREAFFGYLIGKEVNHELLPEAIRALLAFRQDATAELPEVPFQLLTSSELSNAHWRQIARKASWQTTRMNLNTFARHHVFDDAESTRTIAARLSDVELIRKARAFPYQLLAAHRNTENTQLIKGSRVGAVPHVIRQALAKAVDIAVNNVPRINGSVAIAVDVSGSMSSPVTGYRQGATTTLRCVDVAGMMAAAIMARNPGAMVLPFNDSVCRFNWSAKTVLAQAEALAGLLGGGTKVSAPLQALLERSVSPDVVIILSDNQSWMDDRHYGASETMRVWAELKKRNPRAKLICVDLQPYTNSQAKEGGDVLNIGGFSDEVFELIADFTKGNLQAARLVQKVEAISLDAVATA